MTKVQKVMEKNVEDVSKRGESLPTLRDKTRNLASAAEAFQRGASSVRKNIWWKNMKMRIYIVIGICALIAVIAVPGAFIHCVRSS